MNVSVLTGLQPSVTSCFTSLVFCSYVLGLPLPIPLLISVLFGSSGSSSELKERQCKILPTMSLEVWRLFLVCNLHHRKSEQDTISTYMGTLGMCVWWPGDNGCAERLRAMTSECSSLTSILSSFQRMP